jgi:hypothetical protein
MLLLLQEEPSVYRIATIIATLLLSTTMLSQAPAKPHQPSESIAHGHLVVAYRGGTVPRDADVIAALVGARAKHIPSFGVSALQVSGDEELAIAKLLAQPEVATVLHDRYVTGHALILAQQQAAAPKPSLSNNPNPGNPIGLPTPVPIHGPIPVTPLPIGDAYYNSPQGWAVVQAGGYGRNIPGGPATGPWNTTMGAGARIAVLDSGVDENHPDIAPNLAFNLSEVDQASMPSPCDDGSPQDQQGHGTWTASLAAAAIGGGSTVGVAPQATLLNIKVLQRMPGTGSNTVTANCEAGEPAGLLSWALEGIADAMVQKANVISMSFGTLIDITTPDGTAWQEQFNSVTAAATKHNVVLIASLGDDGLNLTLGSGNYLEMPAQSLNVLAIAASTNPACAENLTPGATCTAGARALASYTNYVLNQTRNQPRIIAAPGGNYPEGPGLNDPSAATGFVTGACSNGLPNTADGLPQNGRSFGCFGSGHASYVQAMGTTASAALVAGAAAILHAANPRASAEDIINSMYASQSIFLNTSINILNLPAALAVE